MRPKSVWWTQAPSRVAFFAWSAALGKILTLDNLMKMQVIIVNRCCMCKRSGESVDHIFLYCDVASALWSTLFTCFGSWVMPSSVIDLFACWWTFRSPRSVVIWKMVPICLFWCLWKEINNVFRGFGEIFGRYFSFVFSDFVYLDHGFCVPTVA
jgi:hypothetical protein